MPGLRRTLLPAVLTLLSGACGPKPNGVHEGASHRGGTAAKPSPTETPLAWASDAKTLLMVGLGAGRPEWDNPPVRPGESVQWLVTTTPPSAIRNVKAIRESGDAPTFQLERGPAAASLEVALAPDRARAVSLAWREGAGAPVVLDAPDAIAKLWTPPVLFDDSSFRAAGGSFFGNEVVRVPAGTFRARHGMVKHDGAEWHLYVARGVPGGLVKVERFPEGASSATLVMEIQEFVRKKTPLEPATP